MSDEPEYIRVRFGGTNYIWMKHKNGEGGIAPLEHFTPDGKLDIYHGLVSTSFAHVVEGKIWRYGHCIGTVDDLEFL